MIADDAAPHRDGRLFRVRHEAAKGLNWFCHAEVRAALPGIVVLLCFMFKGVDGRDL